MAIKSICQKVMRIKGVKRVLLLLSLFLFSSLLIFEGKGVKEKKIESYEALYKEMAEDVVGWRQRAVYRTTFEPKRVEYEKIQEEAAKVNDIIGYSVDLVNMMYEPAEDGYKTSVKYSYSMSRTEYGAVNAQVSLLTRLLKDKTPYEIVKFAHDYLILACEYSYSGNSPYDCMLLGRSACRGYALAYKMILEACGIPCAYISSTDHAWNMVCLDGCWYNVDVTWDDKGGMDIGYDYFLKSNADFPKHKGSNATALASYEYIERHKGFELFVFYAMSLLSGRYRVIVVIIGIGIVIWIGKRGRKERAVDS